MGGEGFDFDLDFDLRGFILDEPLPRKLFAPTSSIVKEYCYRGHERWRLSESLSEYARATVHPCHNRYNPLRPPIVG